MERGEMSDELTHGFLVDDSTYSIVNTEDVLDQEENNSDSNGGGKHVPLREQDRFLPIANIAKIMKRAIPENGKIAKDARECVQECLSEFISFVTSEASDRCQVEKRKTINGEDVLYAMNLLGFENYVEPLKLYLKKYRELVLSPMTISKINKTSNIVVFEEEGITESDQVEIEEESSSKPTVIYAYPKVIGEFIG